MAERQEFEARLAASEAEKDVLKRRISQLKNDMTDATRLLEVRAEEERFEKVGAIQRDAAHRFAHAKISELLALPTASANGPCLWMEVLELTDCNHRWRSPCLDIMGG